MDPPLTKTLVRARLTRGGVPSVAGDSRDDRRVPGPAANMMVAPQLGMRAKVNLTLKTHAGQLGRTTYLSRTTLRFG